MRLTLSPRHYWITIVLIAVTFAIYGQVVHHSYVNYDDDTYVYANTALRNGFSAEGVGWAFTTFHTGNWHPTTWLSHMADVSLFGLNPGAHHLVNMLIHAFNVVLLFIILFWMTNAPWRSSFVAVLFAVHPLHVESVAWVAERKDVLSTAFWLLTLGAYNQYIRRPGIIRYLGIFVCLSLGLMSKPMLVTLPFVLLLLDWWPLNRFSPTITGRDEVSKGSAPLSPSDLLLEKIPLLALSAVSCVVTYIAQKNVGVVHSIEAIPLWTRIGNGLSSYVKYLVKTLWPVNLAVFYPHPASVHVGIPVWQVVGAAVFLGAVSFLVVWQRRRCPWLAVGWLWYLGTLVPVIGLVQVGSQAMADRYTYVPLIGIFIMFAWGIPKMAGNWRIPSRALAAGGGMLVLVLSVLAWFQVRNWQDATTLFTHAREVTENNWVAWDKLAIINDRGGQFSKAIVCYREALRIKPDDFYARNGLGVVYLNIGRNSEAIKEFREALSIRPGYEKAHYNLGIALARIGNYDEGIVHLREALRLKPDYSLARQGLGMTLQKRVRIVDDP